MSELLSFMGKMFIIVVIQTVLTIFIDEEKNHLQVKVLNIACMLGSLYLLIDFLFNTVFKDLSTLVKFPF